MKDVYARFQNKQNKCILHASVQLFDLDDISALECTVKRSMMLTHVCGVNESQMPSYEDEKPLECTIKRSMMLTHVCGVNESHTSSYEDEKLFNNVEGRGMSVSLLHLVPYLKVVA